ncbi:MAG: hypothetical protein PHE51_05615 [Eubacteriales bacterium]|nr:hypothetical protein [Eubacteriales bacterium]
MEQIIKIISNKKIIILLAVIGLSIVCIGNMGGGEDPVYSSEEIRLQNILSQIEGVGEVRVMLSKKESKSSFYTDKEDGYLGAVVTAEGGEKISVKEKIIDAVRAVTGLQSHKIVIYKLKK